MIDLKTMYPAQVNSPYTTTLGEISTSDTAVVVADVSVLPAQAPFLLTLGYDKSASETVLVTAVSGNTLTIVRGVDGDALLWVAGTKVARIFTAKDLNDVQDNITALNEGKQDDLSADTVPTKSTPINADQIPLLDSSDGNSVKKVTWARAKDALKTMFPTKTEVEDAVSTLSDEIHEDLDAHLDSVLASSAGTHQTRYNPFTNKVEIFNESTGAWDESDISNWQLDMSQFGTLEDTTWESIRLASDYGIAQCLWSVGDTKSIHIQGTVGIVELDLTLYVYILGFDHNKALEGKGIHFGGFKTAPTDGIDVSIMDGNNLYSGSIDGTLHFNPNHWGDDTRNGGTNFGGWAGCDLRYDILGSTKIPPSGYGATPATNRVGYDAPSDTATNPVPNTLMAALPADLRAVMKPMVKYTDNVGNRSRLESSVTATVDYLPLLSMHEAFGGKEKLYVKENFAFNEFERKYQECYAYYSVGNSQKKFMHHTPTSKTNTMSRTPDATTDSCFETIANGGEDSGYYMAFGQYAHYIMGLSPIFKV